MAKIKKNLWSILKCEVNFDFKVYSFTQLSSLSTGSYTGICLLASCLDEGSKEQNSVRALMCLLHRFVCVCVCVLVLTPALGLFHICISLRRFY